MIDHFVGSTDPERNRLLGGGSTKCPTRPRRIQRKTGGRFIAIVGGEDLGYDHSVARFG